MTQRDQNVFLKAADRFEAWILVRETNERSFQYMRKSLYQPKPIICKPKTANVRLARSDKQVDGLVADPFRWPEAFTNLDDARTHWFDLCLKYGLGEYESTRGSRSSHFGFAIDTEPGSLHEGCLTLEGKYLYGDYDLFDIFSLRQWPMRLSGEQPYLMVTKVPRGPHYAKKFQEEDERDEKWNEIADFINLQLGVQMIQHGSQFIHEVKFQPVLAFGPGNMAEHWSSEEVQTKYKQWNR